MEKSKKRTNMQPAARRNQILDQAQGLFFSKGYDVTTINDILFATKISKGGFYHYFKSKNELLEGILERLMVQSMAAFQPTLEGENLTALQRYDLYFRILREQQTAQMLNSVLPVIVALYRDENAIFLMRLTNMVVEAVEPIFSQILKLGMDEGIFQIDDPVASAKLIIQIGNQHQHCLKPAIEAKTEEELAVAGNLLVASLKHQGLAIDRFLGIPDGTSILRADDFAPAFVQLIREMNFPNLTDGEK